ncbi:hypothetical protein ACH4SP_40635 [Streptomyces sp. NPDC021093]|uniref:hypothetical protein n=1 Tax=Streptomyces sp. NPDC021093 TaxID=3365112 RepID=UPI00378CF010
MLALALADARRKINLLQGRAAPRWAVGAVLGFYALGVLAALGVALGAGALTAHFAPVEPAVADLVPAVARHSWLPAVLATAALALAARPGLVRQVVHPADLPVLRTLPVTPGQLLAVRLVLPTFAPAAGFAAALAAFLCTWLGATAAGRALLPLVLAVGWGAVLVGTAARLCAEGLVAVAPARGARLHTFVWVAVAGAVLGWAAAPLAQGLRARGPLTETLPRALGDTLAGSRPDWWDTLLRQGPGGPALAAVTLAALLAALGCAALRHAAGHRVMREETAPAIRLRTQHGTGAPHDTDEHDTDKAVRGNGPAVAGHGAAGHAVPVGRPGLREVVRLLVAKDVRGALRAPRTAVAGLRFVLLAGTAVLAAGVAHALTADGRAALAIPLPASAGVLVTVLLLAADEAVQIFGIEAERRSWDLLRMSPLPLGALLAGKAAGFALAVAVVAAPAAAGWALLAVGLGPQLLPLAAIGAAAAAAAAAAVIVTALVMPPAEAPGHGRLTRSPAAPLVQAVLAAILMLPATASLPLLPEGPGTGPALARALPALLTLAALAAGAWALRRHDGLLRKVRP